MYWGIFVFIGLHLPKPHYALRTLCYHPIIKIIEISKNIFHFLLTLHLFIVILSVKIGYINILIIKKITMKNRCYLKLRMVLRVINQAKNSS